MATSPDLIAQFFGFTVTVTVTVFFGTRQRTQTNEHQFPFSFSLKKKKSPSLVQQREGNDIDFNKKKNSRQTNPTKLINKTHIKKQTKKQ